MKQPQIPRSTHERIINNGIDVPHQRPSFAIRLDQVGISSKTVWLQLPQGRIPFQAQMTVNLPAQARGIHMSRMEQAISALHDSSFAQPSSYGESLIHELVSLQGCESGQITLKGKLPLERTSVVSQKRSIDSIDIQCRLELCGEELTSLLGVGVCHITACPCTQVYNDDLFSETTEECPRPTHSQRSHTTLWFQRQQGEPTWQQLLACLEQSLHVTQDLLKRPDEAEIVLAAHQQPQFAEDAVRETARSVAHTFAGNLPPDSQVVIESVSLESIHIHDVCCRLASNLAQLNAAAEAEG